LSGRGLCDELITRPEESYRLCCVVVCDLETSRMGAPYIYDISTLRVNDLTFILLTWRKWLAPNNASRQQMGFNSGFKGLIQLHFLFVALEPDIIMECPVWEFTWWVRRISRKMKAFKNEACSSLVSSA